MVKHQVCMVSIQFKLILKLPAGKESEGCRMLSPAMVLHICHVGLHDALIMRQLCFEILGAMHMSHEEGAKTPWIGGSMGNPWWIHDGSMEDPLWIFDGPMVDQCRIHGASLVEPWFIHGESIVRPWWKTCGLLAILGNVKFELNLLV